MKRLACVYTAGGDMLSGMFEKIWPEALGEDIRFNHIKDSNIMQDIVAETKITEPIKDRLFHLFSAAALCDVDGVVCCCSSIGDEADKFINAHPEINMMRIDYPMAKYAAENYDAVAVMATLFTTVQPSCDLVKRIAKEQGKEVAVYDCVIGEARKIQREDPEGAARIAAEAAKKLYEEKGVKCILLAQASMTGFTQAIKEACPDVEVVNSPESFAANIRNFI